MAITKQLPPEVLEVVASQIGDRLGIFGESPHFFLAAPVDGSVAQPEFDLGESFEVWTLLPDAMDEFETGLDLPQLARPTGIWHHQIRSNKEARSFARSKPLGPEPGNWSLRELFVSSLAEEVAAAIDWIEQNAPARVEVRYLSVPTHQIEAFWFLADPASPHFTEWNNKVLIIRASQSAPLRPLEILGSQNFLRLLAEGKRGTGLR